MSSLRYLMSVLVLVLLGAGYLGSQYFYFSQDENKMNRAGEWAAKVDTSPVALLALLILVGSIALSLVRDGEEKS